jgi:hypothetical protein
MPKRKHSSASNLTTTALLVGAGVILLSGTGYYYREPIAKYLNSFPVNSAPSNAGNPYMNHADIL